MNFSVMMKYRTGMLGVLLIKRVPHAGTTTPVTRD